MAKTMTGAERTSRYDIPLCHLEYDYIRDVKDAKYLEKIIKILRSGDEGRYPDLEQFAEKRLEVLNPKSKVLWKAERVSTPRDLDKSEWAQIAGELDDWTSEMKSTEECLSAKVSLDGDIPPVRGKSNTIFTESPVSPESAKQKTSQKPKKESGKKSKRVKPREYQEWDKFDIDAELAMVDGTNDEEEATKVAKPKPVPNVLRKSSKPAIPDHVDSTGLSDAEKAAKAKSEKEKGNEAFRANDFEEALLYYSRSLSLAATVAAFNNRAQAYLKLNEWDKALADCQIVLEREPENIKGVLRRAVAYQGKAQYVNAKNDLQKVLSADPGNMRAQDILRDVEKVLAEQKAKGRRMVIEESDGSDSESESEQPVQPAKTTKSDASSEKSDIIPGKSDASSEKSDIIPGKSDASSEKSDIIPEKSDTSSEKSDIIPEKSDIIPEKSDASSEKSDLISEKSGMDTPKTSAKSKTSSEKSGARTTNKSGKLFNGVKQQSPPKEKTAIASKGSKDIFGEEDVQEVTEQEAQNLNQSCNRVKEVTPSEVNKDNVNPVVVNESKGGKNSKRRKRGKGSGKHQPQQSTKTVEQVKNTTEESKTTAQTATVSEATAEIPVSVSESLTSPVTNKPKSEGAQEDLTPSESTVGSKVAAPVVESPPQPPPQKSLPAAVVKIKTHGNEQFKVGQYGDAILLYDKGIEILLKEEEGHEMNVSVLYSNRAACKLKTGDCEGCVRDCNEALKRAPGSIKPLTRRAQAYEHMEKFRRAYIDFRQVLYLDSSVDVAMQGVNRCMKMLQQMDGSSWRDKLPAVSMSHLTPLITPTAVTPVCTPASTPTDAPPSHPPSQPTPTPEPTLTKEQLFEQHKSKGNSFVQKGDFTSAIPCYTMCITTLPDRSAPYTNRALCQLRLNKPEEVIADCTKALELEADNIKALFRRAQAYKMLEKYDESFHDLTRLLKQDSKNAAARREFQVVINYREQTKKSRLAAEKVETPKTEPQKAEKTQPAVAKQRQRMKIQEISDDDEEEVSKTKPAATSEGKSKQQHKRNKNNRKSKGANSEAKQEVKPAKAEPMPGDSETKPAKSDAKPAKSEAKPAKSEAQPPMQQEPKPVKSDEETSESKGDAKSTEPSRTDKGSGSTEQAKSPTTSDMSNREKKKSPYEFLQAWNALRLTKQTEPYAKLLGEIEPEEVPKVISNKLDGDMLHMIIKCVELLLDQGLFSRSLAYLQQLTSVPRFSMVTMFMGDTEKKDFERVLQKLSACSSCQYLQEDLEKLKKAYSI